MKTKEKSSTRFQSIIRSRISLLLILAVTLVAPVLATRQPVNANSAAHRLSNPQPPPTLYQMKSSEPKVRHSVTTPLINSSDSGHAGFERSSLATPLSFLSGPVRYPTPQGGGENCVNCANRGRSCGTEQLCCPAPWVPTWCG